MVVIYNSFTRKKEPLKPIDGKKIRMYVCGMTVYDFCHIGHARVMVVFDMVARYLRVYPSNGCLQIQHGWAGVWYFCYFLLLLGFSSSWISLAQGTSPQRRARCNCDRIHLLKIPGRLRRSTQDEVENANKATFLIFLKKVIGLRLAKNLSINE